MRHCQCPLVVCFLLVLFFLRGFEVFESDWLKFVRFKSQTHRGHCIRIGDINFFGSAVQCFILCIKSYHEEKFYQQGKFKKRPNLVKIRTCRQVLFFLLHFYGLWIFPNLSSSTNFILGFPKKSRNLQFLIQTERPVFHIRVDAVD